MKENTNKTLTIILCLLIFLTTALGLGYLYLNKQDTETPKKKTKNQPKLVYVSYDLTTPTFPMVEKSYRVSDSVLEDKHYKTSIDDNKNVIFINKSKNKKYKVELPNVKGIINTNFSPYLLLTEDGKIYYSPSWEQPKFELVKSACDIENELYSIDSPCPSIKFTKMYSINGYYNNNTNVKAFAVDEENRLFSIIYGSASTNEKTIKNQFYYIYEAEFNGEEDIKKLNYETNKDIIYYMPGNKDEQYNIGVTKDGKMLLLKNGEFYDNKFLINENEAKVYKIFRDNYGLNIVLSSDNKLYSFDTPSYITYQTDIVLKPINEGKIVKKLKYSYDEKYTDDFSGFYIDFIFEDNTTVSFTSQMRYLINGIEKGEK